MTKSVRDRRAKCFWEPTYAPNLVGKLQPADWDFTSADARLECFLEGGDLIAAVAAGAPRVIKKVRFTRCDFQGFFQFDTQFVFKECEFIDCDLALTTWDNIKFTKCKFQNSSFGQTVLKRCEFRNCVWERVALSSNGTVLEETFVSNPGKMIAGAFTTLDPQVLKGFNADPLEQWYRYEGSKATIARSLLHNHRINGDDNTFYESVKAFEKQQSFARLAESIYRARRGKFLGRMLGVIATAFWACELVLLSAFGALNGWGATTLRPLCGLLFTFLAFALIYAFGFEQGLAEGGINSFDITSVAGYTKAVSGEAPYIPQLVYALHLLVSATLYTVFFATVVARLSRVR